jgi:hypothetical protein
MVCINIKHPKSISNRVCNRVSLFSNLQEKWTNSLRSTQELCWHVRGAVERPFFCWSPSWVTPLSACLCPPMFQLQPWANILFDSWTWGLKFLNRRIQRKYAFFISTLKCQSISLKWNILVPLVSSNNSLIKQFIQFITAIISYDIPQLIPG